MCEHKQDKDFILNNVKRTIDILEYADKKLLNNKQFMIDVFKVSSGLALKYASDELKNDKECVVQALQNSAGFALKYANENLQSDREIVSAAIKRWRYPLRYSSVELQKEFNSKIDEYYKKHKI